jgi:hypothetical protein
MASHSPPPSSSLSGGVYSPSLKGSFSTSREDEVLLRTRREDIARDRKRMVFPWI